MKRKQAESPKSFVLYCDMLDSLCSMSMEDVGRLFTAILEYKNHGALLTPLPIHVRVAFDFMRTTLDRDAESYEEKCRQLRENGAKGGRPKKGTGEEMPMLDLEEEEKANASQLQEKNQKVFKKPYNDSDSDTETESVTVSDSVSPTVSVGKSENKNGTEGEREDGGDSDGDRENRPCDEGEKEAQTEQSRADGADEADGIIAEKTGEREEPRGLKEPRELKETRELKGAKELKEGTPWDLMDTDVMNAYGIPAEYVSARGERARGYAARMGRTVTELILSWWQEDLKRGEKRQRQLRAASPTHPPVGQRSVLPDHAPQGQRSVLPDNARQVSCPSASVEKSYDGDEFFRAALTKTGYFEGE